MSSSDVWVPDSSKCSSQEIHGAGRKLASCGWPAGWVAALGRFCVFGPRGIIGPKTKKKELKARFEPVEETFGICQCAS
jgi:hypothetical protein